MAAVHEREGIQTGTVHLETVQLELGDTLHEVEVAFERTGAIGQPVILVCHALTGNQHATTEWWTGLIGKGKSVDTEKFQVICLNVLGGCHGTTGPASLNPETGRCYQTDFPFITIRDMVRVQYQALRKLGIAHVHAIIGGSLGGMQVLEFGIMYPDFMNHLFPLAVTPTLSDYGMAFNTIGRKAIMDDPLWKNGRYDPEHPPVNGLSTARMVGMVTYRSAELFNKRFQRNPHEGWGSNFEEKAFDVERYLFYQGKKLAARFDANSYLYLLKAMDSHDIGRDRGGISEAVKNIQASVTAVSYSNDLLYPPEAMEEMITGIATTNAFFYKVETPFGHDGFLVGFEKWGRIIREGLDVH